MSALTNALDALIGGSGSLKNVNNALVSFGDSKIAAAALAKVGVERGISDKVLTSMLQSAYGATAVAANSAGNIMSEALSDAKSVAPQASSAISGVSGAFNTAKTAASGFLTTIKAILPTLGLFAIGTAAVVAGKFAWDHIFTNNAANKQYDKSVDKYNDAKSEVDSLQSQYNSNKDRIQELRAKENRSPDENIELSNLQKENQLIIPQKNVKEKVANTAQHAQAISSANALNKKSLQKNYNWGEETNGNKGFLNNLFGGGEMREKISISDLDEASEMIYKLNNLKNERDKIINNRSKPSDFYFSSYQSEERQLKDYDTQISELESNLSDKMSDISGKSQKFWDDQGNLLEESTRDTAAQTEKLFDDYAKATGSTDNISDKINNVFALSDYADLQDKLTEIGKKSGLKGIKNALKDDNTYSNLLSALDNKNVSLDNLTDYIMSIADPDAKNIEGIKENLKDEFAYNKKLNNFFKDKSDEDIEGFWNYYQNQGFDAEEYNWDKQDLSKNWDEYLKSTKEAATESATFASKFKNSAEDTATDIDTVTDNFQSDMSSIKSAMDSLKKGTLQSSDLTDLIQQYPELAEERYLSFGTLNSKLNDLAEKRASTAIGKIHDSVKDSTIIEKNAAKFYINDLLNEFNTSDLKISDGFVKKKLKANILKNSDLSENEASDRVDRIMKRANMSISHSKINSSPTKDEYLQALYKISMDSDLNNMDDSTLAHALNTLLPQIKIDTAKKNLDNLADNLTRLQTQASDRQSIMTNKTSKNQKVDSQDYNALISNGNNQIKVLRDQIKNYQKEIEGIKEKGYLDGVTPGSDEEKEKIKSYQDQIQSAQMSIENMKASQAGWLEEIQNLPITDVTNLASALSTAIGETNSETGLTSDSVKNLVTQFSDLTAQGTDINGLFTRSAKGLQLNTDRFQELSKAQNEMVTKDFASQIADQEKKIYDSNGNIIESEKQKLEELKNLQNEYLAQYKAMEAQTSQWQRAANAESTPNAGDHYKATKSKLESLKEMYDNGETGTDDFKEGAAYFSPYGFSDEDNFIENYNKWKPYYTDDASGPLKFLDLLKSKGLATYKTLEDGSKQWQMAFTDSADAAKTLGMGEEQFRDYLGRYDDMGAVVTDITSVAEGQANVTEKTNELISAQEKYSELVANGAPQYAIEQQAQVVDDLKNQVNDANTALDTYVNGATDREVQNLNTVKQTINDFAKEYQQVKDDPAQQEYAQGLYDRIQQLAKDNKIKLTPEFEVDEDAFNQMLHDKGIGTFDSPLTAEEMGISDPTAAKEYVDSLEAVKQAHEANAEATEADFNALKQYTAADLEGIQLGDDAYNVEGMEQAEDALQNLADQAGLTKDQLVQALEGLGVLKPKVDSSEIEEAGEKAEETSADLQNLSGSTYTIEANLSTSGGTDDLKNSLASIPQGTTATVDVSVTGEDQVEDLTSAMESVPDNTPVTITCDVQNQEQLDAINAKADELNGQNKQITVNATIKKDSTEVDSYKPEDKDAKAKYTVEDSDVQAYKPPDKTGVVNYIVNASNIALWTPPDKSGTVVYHAKVEGAPKGASASGTMTSIAHADGTAYNMLNLKPLSSAHAGGNVALGKNETALTNEVGTESIVRDGVWSLLPGGPHFENLKKGDIIFNASQTKDLLEHGKTSSNARAYATGSLGCNAYALTGFNFKDTSSKKSSSTKSSGNNNSGGGGNSGSSGGSGGGSSSSSKSWEDPWKNVVDWFERLVTRFENRIDLAQSKSENSTVLSTKNNYLTKAINDSNTLMEDYIKGRNLYVRASDNYAKKIGLSAALKKKVQDGTVDIQSLSETDKSKVEAYQKWYDKIVECDKAIQDLKSQEKELYQQRLDNVTDKYDALRSVYENQNNTLSSLNDWASEAGNSQGVGSGYYQNIIKQRNNQNTQTNLITSEIKEYQKQLNQIKKKYGVNSTFYKEALAGLEELRTALNDSKKATAELTNQLDKLAANAAQYKTDKYTRASEKQSAYRDYKDANRYYDAKTGDFAKGITETDYRNAITTNNNTLNALQEQKNLVQQKMLTLNAGSAEYQEYADQLAELDKKILETANSNAELKKSIVDLRFKQFDEAQDKLDDLIEDYGNLRDMMDSDTFYNDDGSFTDSGLANISLINKEMDAYKQEIADCTAELEDLEKLKKSGTITADQYKERSENAMNRIQQASKSLYSSQQSLLDMYSDKITKENDLLQENIDKRKKALDNKKDYYEYDKTIKDKSKDINALKAQIAALEGTTNAAAKAKLAKLKADLKDKEEDLADTKYEHQLDMESKGYDDLSEKADDTLDNTLKSLKSNTDLQKSVINDMLSEVKNSYKETFDEISKILEETGYKTADLFKDLMNANTIKNSTNETVNEAKNHPGNYTNVDTSGIPSDSKADVAISGALKDSESAGKASNNIGYDQNGKSYSAKLALSLSPKSATIYVGKKQTVKVNYKNAATDNLKNFTLTVKDSSIATAQKNGNSFIVTGKKSGKTTVTVHPVVSSAAAVTFNVTVRQKNYDKYAKTVNDALNKSGYKFSYGERQEIKDSLILGKSDKDLNDKKKFNEQIQKSIKKNQLTKWYKNLKNKTFKPADYKNNHELIQHFKKKGKDVTGAQLVSAAKILGLKYPGNYSKWTGTQKTNLLKQLQTFGFSKGGVVRNLIPADMGTMLGDAIIRNGDTGFIGARPGETVLTEEFTKLLKPSIASMNEFTDMMTGNNGAKLNNVPSVQNQNITFNPEINLNVDRIDSELDIKNLAHQLSGIMFDDFTKKMSKDWKKLTGRNR